MGWKAPKGMSSLENRDDLLRSYKYRDGRCPYCKRYPIHVGLKGPNEPGEIWVRLGSTHQAEVREQSFADMPDAYRVEDRVKGGPQIRHLPDDTVAIRCFEKCEDGIWRLSLADLESKWRNAVERGDKSFELPLVPKR